MNYKEQIEKEAVTGEYRSGDFGGNSNQSADSGFRSGQFKKTKEQYKNDINQHTRSATRYATSTPTRSNEAKHQKTNNEALSIREKTDKHLSDVTNSIWYRRLPNSLQDDLKPHIRNDIQSALVNGMNEDIMKVLVAHKTNKRVSEDTLNKYKELDSSISNVYSSKEYQNKYDSLTAKKTGLKIGTGVGALAGLGLGLAGGTTNRLGKVVLSGGLGAGLGAGFGRLTGVAMDQNGAFNHAQNKVSPNLDRIRNEARYSLNY